MSKNCLCGIKKATLTKIPALRQFKLIPLQFF